MTNAATEFNPWSIALSIPTGELFVLDGFNTYQDAQKGLQQYSEQYPDRCVDVYSRGVLNGVVVVDTLV